MKSLRILALCVLLAGIASVAQARLYFLPDYQYDMGGRNFNHNGYRPGSNPQCRAYSLYGSIQSDMRCNTTPRHPAPGLTCYYCEPCPSEYKYDTSTCPTSDYTLSGNCGNKYTTCTCDTTKFQATSLKGCPDGYVIEDEEHYCEDKPSGKKHWVCVKPQCSSTTTIKECEAQGNKCKRDQSSPLCEDYCDSAGCLPICDYYLHTSEDQGIITNCKHGCATGKKVENCSGLCWECESCEYTSATACENAEAPKYSAKHPVEDDGISIFNFCMLTDDNCYMPTFRSCAEIGLANYKEGFPTVEFANGTKCSATCATQYTGSLTLAECNAQSSSATTCSKVGTVGSVDCYNLKCKHTTQEACNQTYDYTLGSGAGAGYFMIHPISGLDLGLLDKCQKNTSGCWTPVFKTCSQLGLEDATDEKVAIYENSVEFINGRCVATCTTEYSGSMITEDCKGSLADNQYCTKVGTVKNISCSKKQTCPSGYTRTCPSGKTCVQSGSCYKVATCSDITSVTGVAKRNDNNVLVTTTYSSPFSTTKGANTSTKVSDSTMNLSGERCTTVTLTYSVGGKTISSSGTCGSNTLSINGTTCYGYRNMTCSEAINAKGKTLTSTSSAATYSGNYYLKGDVSLSAGDATINNAKFYAASSLSPCSSSTASPKLTISRARINSGAEFHTNTEIRELVISNDASITTTDDFKIRWGSIQNKNTSQGASLYIFVNKTKASGKTTSVCWMCEEKASSPCSVYASSNAVYGSPVFQWGHNTGEADAPSCSGVTCTNTASCY